MTTDETGPTVRALRVLDVLQRRPGVRACELAERLGVSERAVRRSVAALRAADVAVESTSGPYGGYRLGRGLRLPPLRFTSTEALALVMAVLDGQHAAAAVGDPVADAVGTIIRALPVDVGRQAALMREHARAAPGRRPRPDPVTTAALVDAVAARAVVRLAYTPRSGTPRTRTVEPWAVVVRGGLWYLLARAVDLDAPRTYRVDRVGAVETLPSSAGTVVPPPDLDAVAWLEEHLGSGRALATRVRFHAPYDEVAPWIRPVMGRLAPTPDGECVLEGTTDNPAMVANEWLAAVPRPMTVEGGPELRLAVDDLARRLAASVAASSA
ncbi:WYL domain-containing protein [Nocardioides sp. CFH 31398]|uniref:helix-turn-helix transcriptional regulator n=1 Tax=Nocardioides sp. CFH 31398 TaxID=2919579 RepID=UPI0027DFEDD8|nr:WYL domain-containing protein [Nocardioides sp. CFH 31398]